jgi:hypothetical protein
MGLHQIKMVLHIKGTITRIKRQPTEWENIFASCSCDKRLILRLHKEFKILNSKRTNNQLIKGQINKQYSK